MDPLFRTFQEMFIPQQHLSIDGVITSYKEQLSFLQCLPKKVGVKAWALGDSKLGYIYGSEPLGVRVAVEQLSGLKNKGYHVDNFYSRSMLTLCKRLLTLRFGGFDTGRLDQWETRGTSPPTKMGISLALQLHMPAKTPCSNYTSH